MGVACGVERGHYDKVTVSHSFYLKGTKDIHLRLKHSGFPSAGMNMTRRLTLRIE